MGITIRSYNVRGIRDFQKHKQMFQFIKKQKVDIAILQETHSIPSDEYMWGKQWGTNILFSHGTSNSKGVAILIGSSLERIIKISDIRRDGDGRFIMALFSLPDSIEFNLINVYAPNDDNPEMFQDIFKILEQSDCTSNVIGGDFNVALDPNMDCTTRVSHTKTRQLLLDYIEEKKMVDIWRSQNPVTKSYTWFRLTPERIFSRLDYFLITEDLATCSSSDISAGYRSDHSSVKLELNHEQIEKRGKGNWRFNTTFLKNIDFLSELNDTVEEAKSTFEPCDAILKWEMIKLKITECCIDFQKRAAELKKQKFQKLNKEITKLNNKLINDQNESTYAELEERKRELENYITEKTRGIIFRSKATWHEEGERNTKYFFSLEKARYRNKTVHTLKTEDGKNIVNNKEILQECKKFYQNLYYEDPESKNFGLINSFHTTITNESQEMLDRDITVDEIGIALKSFENDKAPGCDGLPADIYKILWPKLKNTLLEYYEAAYLKQQLGPSARRGILSLLPKKNNDLTLLKNWRPITLLNFDYKLLSKVLALRLQKVLPEIIEKHQTGFMKGRSITDNIRTSIEILGHSKRTNANNIIMSIDFKKCFDSVKKSAITGAFRFFGFGEDFIRWVDIMFDGFMLSVQNNGETSPWFEQKKGYHQGCCFSPLGFLVTAQIFSLYLKSNSSVKGVDVDNFLIMMMQFADDTDLFIKCEKAVLNGVTDTLGQIQDHTGLTVNYEKTTVTRLGTLSNTDFKVITKQTLVWSNNPLNVLGVIASEDLNTRTEQNFLPLIPKVENVLNIWRCRQLTLTGKVLVVNTLVESLFVYRMSVIELMPNEYYEKLEKIVEKFIWPGKVRMKSTCLQCPKSQGGLRLVNFKNKHLALLTQWVFKIQTNNFFQHCMYKSLGINVGEYIWYVNLHPRDVEKNCRRTILLARCTVCMVSCKF